VVVVVTGETSTPGLHAASKRAASAVLRSFRGILGEGYDGQPD